METAQVAIGFAVVGAVAGWLCFMLFALRPSELLPTHLAVGAMSGLAGGAFAHALVSARGGGASYLPSVMALLFALALVGGWRALRRGVEP